MKTDNSHFEEKVQLRMEVLRLLNKKKVSVLELYAGRGKIWKEISRRWKGEISLLGIEKERGKNKSALVGDNMKFIGSIDVGRFDIIDVDAYGIPAAQLQHVSARGYKGYVIVTAIQSMYGTMPLSVLHENGITPEMHQRCPTLFAQKGWEFLKNYLYALGARKVTGYHVERKHYFFFKFE